MEFSRNEQNNEEQLHNIPHLPVYQYSMKETGCPGSFQIIQDVHGNY